jgi:glycosyltransferase involved in cell wall biosynthesis
MPGTTRVSPGFSGGNLHGTMLRPDPTSPFSDAFFALREAASRLKNLPARRSAKNAASDVLIAPGAAPVLSYGRRRPSGQNRLPIGGEIKLIPLRERFPESFREFNLMYLVSSALPPHVEELVAVAKARGARLVWNQNGVAYPGCYGDFYPWFNRRMAGLRAQADYIINQSEFSRMSAERYLGGSSVPSEICFNPVDTAMFSPAPQPVPRDCWQILAAGTSHALYRTKSALDTLRVLLSRGHKVHLTIAGEFRWKNAAAQVAAGMDGIGEHVTVLPPFRQSEAPGIYRQAHVLLHTKYNDPCPTVPIEAMACGLPVVGTASGGMPELVAGRCGALVPVEQGWDCDRAGDPGQLADAVENVMDDWSATALAARTRAVETFDVRTWLERHVAVFQGLVGETGNPSRGKV